MVDGRCFTAIADAKPTTSRIREPRYCECIRVSRAPTDVFKSDRFVKTVGPKQKRTYVYEYRVVANTEYRAWCVVVVLRNNATRVSEFNMCFDRRAVFVCVCVYPLIYRMRSDNIRRSR